MPKGALLDWMILSRIPLIVVGGSDLRSVSFKLANRGDVFGEHHFLFNVLLPLLSALQLGGEDINRKYCSTNAALQFAGVVPSLSLSLSDIPHFREIFLAAFFPCAEESYGRREGGRRGVTWPGFLHLRRSILCPVCFESILYISPCLTLEVLYRSKHEFILWT